MICKNCNTWVPEGSTFCPYCGSQLQNISREPPQGQTPSRQTPPSKITLPPDISNAIVFKPDERPVRVWQTRYTIRVQSKGSEEEEKYRSRGYLIATNERLIYLENRSGLFSSGYYIKESIDHEQIRGSMVVNWLLASGLSLSIESQGISRSILFWNASDLDLATFGEIGKISPEYFQESLNFIISRSLAEKKEEKRKERIQYILDFSFLKMQMEKGGVVVQNIKCPNCGASVVLPSGGSSMTCQYCGSMIYAQDVFDKMKGLIGGL